jgi:hypothetical protein
VTIAIFGSLLGLGTALDLAGFFVNNPIPEHRMAMREEINIADEYNQS